MAAARPVLPPPLPPRETWLPLLELALSEDLRADCAALAPDFDLQSGDVTTASVVDAARLGQARVEAREPLVVCGLPIVEAVFRRVDPELEIEREAGVEDGLQLEAPAPLLRIQGRYSSILIGERTALNFLGRLCGVASQTRRLTDRVAGTRAALVDTRKTTPGWRHLEKYAVRVGGGVNHRVGLYDALLVKDNHIAAAADFDHAVRRALEAAPDGIPIQIEVESRAMADRAIELGARFLLLDNMTPGEIRAIVEQHAENVTLEASGGIGAHNVADYAATGVERISMGALTHSVVCADVALEVDLLPHEDRKEPNGSDAGRAR